jgi:hypothetical protein
MAHVALQELHYRPKQENYKQARGYQYDLVKVLVGSPADQHVIFKNFYHILGKPRGYEIQSREEQHDDRAERYVSPVFCRRLINFY